MPKVNKTVQAMLEKKTGIDRVTPCTLPSSTSPSVVALPIKASVPEMNNNNGSSNASPIGLPQIPEEMSQHLSASQFLTTSVALDSTASMRYQQPCPPHQPRVITGYISKPSPSSSPRGAGGGYSASEALQMQQIIQARRKISAGGGSDDNHSNGPKSAGGLAAASAARAKARQAAPNGRSGAAHQNMHDLVQMRKDAIAKQKQEEKEAKEAALRDKALQKNSSTSGGGGGGGGGSSRSSSSNQRNNLFGFFSSLGGGKQNQHRETSQTSMTPTVLDGSLSEL